MNLRPKYKMELIKNIEEEIFKLYNSYYSAEKYIINFQKILEWDDWNNEEPEYNFKIHHKNIKDKDVIDVAETLHNTNDEILILIAIDLDIDVPMVLPSFPTFQRILTEKENSLSYVMEQFKKAYSMILTDSEQSIILSNSTLESIVKYILNDLKITYNQNDSLYKLTQTILKEFNYFPNEELQENIKKIGSSLLCISQGIADIRNQQTSTHGKSENDYLIGDSLYSIFIFNNICSVGMFLIQFYNKKYKENKECNIVVNDNEIPF